MSLKAITETDNIDDIVKIINKSSSSADEITDVLIKSGKSQDDIAKIIQKIDNTSLGRDVANKIISSSKFTVTQKSRFLEILKNNPKFILGVTGVSGYIAYNAIQGKINADILNSTLYKISEITELSLPYQPGSLQIKITPMLDGEICPNDRIKISNVSSDPNINGDYTASLQLDGTFIINSSKFVGGIIGTSSKLKSLKKRSDGTFGDLSIVTTEACQEKKIRENTTQDIGNIAGDFFSGLTQGSIKSIFESNPLAFASVGIVILLILLRR